MAKAEPVSVEDDNCELLCASSSLYKLMRKCVVTMQKNREGRAIKKTKIRIKFGSEFIWRHLSLLWRRCLVTKN